MYLIDSPPSVDYEWFEQTLKIDTEFEPVEISINKILEDNGKVDVLKE